MNFGLTKILYYWSNIELFCAASVIERSKLSATVTSFQPRPAVVGPAAHPPPSPLTAVAAGVMRALLPISTSRPVALPIVR